MNRALLLMLGAVPGVAFGYFLLTSYLLGQIRPLPITFLPQNAPRELPKRRQPSAV